VTAVDDSVNAYRQAERRLRELLLGDGTINVGLVKGEERRLETTRILRRMRSAFEAVVEQDEGRAAEAEARLADLEEALREALARSRHRSEAA
jgi:D-aminopeptidase